MHEMLEMQQDRQTESDLLNILKSHMHIHMKTIETKFCHRCKTTYFQLIPTAWVPKGAKWVSQFIHKCYSGEGIHTKKSVQMWLLDIVLSASTFFKT